MSLLKPEQKQIIPKENSKNNSRRNFIKKSAWAAILALIGTDIVFASKMPSGLIPALLFHDDNITKLLGKHPELIVLNNKPWNIETPPHLLDDDITPADKLFVRNNGLYPENIDSKAWTLTIEGEAAKQKTVFTLDELKSKFKHYTYQLTLECAGNGRSEYNPPTHGEQWTVGAVGCPVWTGVRLKDVLEYTGIKRNAVYIGYYGKDIHLSKDPNQVVISRGVPIVKALEDESLIAWAVNGKEIPLPNGYPLRLIFGGWPGSTSGKWLHTIAIRNKVHDGPKMESPSYRVPCNTVAPGSKVPEEDMCIIESMPVKSIVTYPKTGAMINYGKSLEVRGHAWAGDLQVAEMHVSIDFGAAWVKCKIMPPPNRLAWQRWSTQISFPKKGYYEVWAKATDTNGNSQPMVVPGWNPKGYVNNACHRIAVKIV